MPFIPDAYAIEQCEGSTDLAKFTTMLLKLQAEKKEQKAEFYTQLAASSKAIAQNYTKTRR